MKILPTTTEYTKKSQYYDGAEDFFAKFGDAFDLVRSQILKVETRQSYQEPDSVSFRHIVAGDWDQAMATLEESRVDDVELYADLNEQGIDFVRCRPISFPFTNYMRWEMEVYKFNARHGEKIFCCNLDAVDSLFQENILHDFMIFDARIAFIHDYNSEGLIKGGWVVTDLESIVGLHTLFSFLRSQCRPFSFFVE